MCEWFRESVTGLFNKILGFLSSCCTEITSFFFFFFLPSPGATVLLCLDRSPSLFTLSSLAVSQTAKLDDLAIQRAENSCMKPSKHLDKPSLKRPGNVTPIQTQSFLLLFSHSSRLSLTPSAGALLHFPAAHWFGGEGSTNKCFPPFLPVSVVGEN